MKQSRIFSVLIIAVIEVALVVAACNSTPTPAPIASQAIGVTRFNGDVEIGGKTLIKGVATFNSAANFAGDATVSGAFTGGSLAGGSVLVGGIISGASLTLNGVAQTGAVRSGSASTVVTGTKIEHGAGTTPTAFMLTPAYAPAAVFSQTLYPISCNVTSCTVGVSSGSVTTFTTVYWMAQR